MSTVDLDSHVQLGLDALIHRHGQWTEHLLGIASELDAAGYPLVGWTGTISSDAPRGSGLSSSAALQIALTQTFSVAAGFPWKAQEMALLAQRAENEWVGNQCGIMDQLTSAAATEGAALLIDCRSLETTEVKLPTNVSVVVMDTSTRRGLVETEYNERRASCEAAAAVLGVSQLRDANLEMLASHRPDLDETRYRRAKHVISENARAIAAYEQRSDPETFGRLMNESHFSMRDDFEASGPELDLITSLARSTKGCFDARLTGAGFAGAAVALVAREEVRGFVASVSQAFTSASGLIPDIRACRPEAGASRTEFPS